ncbi:hypothetical protein DOY81_013235, partial [Sarcophaga bullata]
MRCNDVFEEISELNRGLINNSGMYFFVGAHLYPNVKGCVYSMAIPIPSFIISVIYLTYAYFKIYNEDEETAPLDKNAEDMDIDDEGVDDSDGAASLITLQVQMADELSRDSLDNGVISTSNSVQ